MSENFPRDWLVTRFFMTLHLLLNVQRFFSSLLYLHEFFSRCISLAFLFLLPFRSSAWFFKLYEKHLSHKQCASSNRITITSHQVFTRTCIFHFDRVYNETALEPVMHIPVKKSNTIKRWWLTIILKLCALFQFTNSAPIFYEQTKITHAHFIICPDKYQL